MAVALANFHQKMNSLRIEADENASKAEELKTKVKTLEQENLQKEQEITSLTHRNQLLEGEVEKLETGVKEAKALASESSQHGQQNEALTRRLQLLEEEAETSDKTLRETNDKYVPDRWSQTSANVSLDFAKRMLKPAITSEKFKQSSKHETSGSRSTKRWRRSTPTYRRNCRSWSKAWAISDWGQQKSVRKSIVERLLSRLSSRRHANRRTDLVGILYEIAGA